MDTWSFRAAGDLRKTSEVDLDLCGMPSALPTTLNLEPCAVGHELKVANTLE